MERLEVSIVSSVLKLFSLISLVVQIFLLVSVFAQSGQLQIISLLNIFIIPLGAYGLALIIDLLSGIEIALKNRTANKPQTEDWQLHPPKR